MVPCWDQRIVKQPFWCVYGDLWTRYFKMLSILSSSEHHKHSRCSIYFASDLKMVSRSRSIINIMKLWFQGPWFAPPCDIWKLQNVPGGEGSQAAITGFWYISQIDLRRKGPGSPSFHYFVVISFLSKKNSLWYLMYSQLHVLFLKQPSNSHSGPRKRGRAPHGDIETFQYALVSLSFERQYSWGVVRKSLLLLSKVSWFE